MRHVIACPELVSPLQSPRTIRRSQANGLDTAKKSPRVPVDTPLQTPSPSTSSASSAQVAEYQALSTRLQLRGIMPPPGLAPPRELSPPPGYTPPGPKPPGPASWPIIRMVVWPGVHTIDHLPLGQKFELNKPRQLTIEVPSNITNAPVRWEAYTSVVDFSNEESVLAVNQWRELVVERARLGILKRW
jgi:hypothetical protein